MRGTLDERGLRIVLFVCGFALVLLALWWPFLPFDPMLRDQRVLRAFFGILGNTLLLLSWLGVEVFKKPRK